MLETVSTENRKLQDFTHVSYHTIMFEITSLNQNITVHNMLHRSRTRKHTSCTQRLQLKGWDACWTSGSKERREHSKKAKNTQEDKQWPTQSTARLFWFSQLMAGEGIKNFSEGRRWGSSIDVYGTFLHEGWKSIHLPLLFQDEQGKERPQQGFSKCLKVRSINRWDYMSNLHSMPLRMTVKKGQEEN